MFHNTHTNTHIKQSNAKVKTIIQNNLYIKISIIWCRTSHDDLELYIVII